MRRIGQYCTVWLSQDFHANKRDTEGSTAEAALSEPIYMPVGQLIEVTEEEFDELPLESRRTIEIDEFAEKSERRSNAENGSKTGRLRWIAIERRGSKTADRPKCSVWTGRHAWCVPCGLKSNDVCERCGGSD